MIKTHERRKCCFFRGRDFIFFTRLLQKNKKQKKKRQTKLVRFFFLERDKKEKDRIFFKTALHSFLHLLLISLVLLFLLWCLSATFRRPQTEKVSASVVAF